LSSFHRILVGWDGSKDSRQAFRTATRLAVELHAEVVVLAVLKRPSRAEAADEAAEDSAHRRSEVVDEMRTEARHEGAATTVRLRHEVIEADQTAPAFDAYAREHGFDLVVVGRHGLDRAVHPRIGGVSEHQVRHGGCPVMVVGCD
jgi:nucleotide-binding universal stress UspA family protein